MGNQSAADILRGTGDDATKLKEVVGKTFTITDFEVKTSKKFSSDFVLIEAINEDGDDVTLMGGGHLAPKLQKLQKHGFLSDGLEVKVVSFDTDLGTGYGLDPVEG